MTRNSDLETRPLLMKPALSIRTVFIATECLHAELRSFKYQGRRGGGKIGIRIRDKGEGEGRRECGEGKGRGAMTNFKKRFKKTKDSKMRDGQSHKVLDFRICLDPFQTYARRVTKHKPLASINCGSYLFNILARN